MSAKILLVDFETAPILGYSFKLYETNVIHVVRDSFVLSCAWKWLGEKKTYCKGLNDYPLYKYNKYDDSDLLKDVHSLFDSADVIVAHNGDSFDIKVANSRFIQKGLEPIGSKITIDTLKQARKKFRFTSNKLTDLAKYAGLGQKKESGGVGTWIGCIEGDKKSWRLMKKYNAHDVVLLEGIYKWMRPWLPSPINPNVIEGKIFRCTNIECKKSDLVKRGFEYTKTGKYQTYQCRTCGHRCTSRVNLAVDKPLVK